MKRTKENHVFCERQIDRLQGTAFWGTLSPLAIDELVDALYDAAESTTDAELIITLWLREHPEYPHVSDIYAMTRRAKEESERVLPQPCPNCQQFSGRVMISYVRKTGVFAGETATALKPCHCALGRILAAAEAKFKAEPAPVFEDSLRPVSDEELERLANLMAMKSNKDVIQ